MTWIKINPLLILRSLISAAYLNKSVIVASLGDETVMLSLPFGQPSWWTLNTIGIYECKMPYFLSTFNGDIHLTGST